MNFALTLIKWFETNARDLPWRHTHDAYAIWLSEIILQQTRIDQGEPYWQRFMEHWPTVEDLAAATEDEVLRQWQGLGYYSRARHLLFAARQIVEQGGFPTTIDSIRRLKGVGDYTAAAIASFAFGQPAAVVDGNVYRVLARHYGISTPINTTEGKKEFAALAQALLPCCETAGNTHHGKSQLTAIYNQAIMDFGALQCTPANPQCNVCPLQESCVAWREARVAELPVKKRTMTTKELHIIYIYIRHQGLTALHRRAGGNIWQGLYEPWLVKEPPSGARLLRKGVKHILTHRIVYADFYLWEPAEQPELPEGYFWINEAERDRYAVSRLVEMLFQAVQ